MALSHLAGFFRLEARGTLAAMSRGVLRSRAWLIAVGVAGGIALAIAAAWFLLLRDVAEPVGVEEAVTSFRTDTEPTPEDASPIPEGVYVYATDGFETTDALTGVRHPYPRESTIAVRSADCGVTLLWRVLEGRSTEWTYCTTPEGWELASQDERHTFFGRTERTTYTCEDTPIRPVADTAGTSWDVSCDTDTAEDRLHAARGLLWLDQRRLRQPAGRALRPRAADDGIDAHRHLALRQEAGLQESQEDR